LGFNFVKPENYVNKFQKCCPYHTTIIIYILFYVMYQFFLP